MIPTKQTVYIPVSEFNNSERVICTIGIPDLYGDKVIEQEGYFFTPEQLNEYTQTVIKEALETAAESRCLNIFDKKWFAYSFDAGTKILDRINITIDKQSITNTFEKTFKHFKV